MTFTRWITSNRLSTDERGAGLVEYALIVGLIAVVAVVAVGAVGGALDDSFTSSNNAFATASGNATEEPTYPSKSAGIDGEIEATFALIDGTVVMTDSFGPGWTMQVVKDTGTRVNTKWTNDTTGEVVRVNGWVNKKGNLRTKVREI